MQAHPDLTHPEAVARAAADAANRVQTAPGVHHGDGRMFADAHFYADSYTESTRHLSHDERGLLPDASSVHALKSNMEPMRIDVLGDAHMQQKLTNP
mmetsp:Transcript_9416/g.13118  ORF Transcript_9416/g.13118 Transcript_9416/m.13118 type:complete len:97 (+) Transcript_9416:80-370(+)